ncbi:hypothetical protein BH09BAC4_BH09BAC4_23440 [soil metagenome]
MKWVTHFCAPVFVFLSGVSAYLYGQKKSTGQLTTFLLKRGMYLLRINTSTQAATLKIFKQ